MIVHANAKINLSLDVLGTLPNGYHTVKMIMQSVDLHDELRINKNDSGSVNMTCDNRDLPCDDHNLVIRAIKALLEKTGKTDGITVELTKNIPMAAGLAGGSADAAAVLVGVNELMGYGLSLDELKAIGGALGADIPFCIQGGTCLAEGIGEILTPIASMPECHIVLIKPPFDVSTAFVYKNLILDNNTNHPDVEKMVDMLNDMSINGIAGSMGNILEDVTVSAYPQINEIKKFLSDNSALGAMMSGSGPTVFGIFDDTHPAKAVIDAISHDRYRDNDLNRGIDSSFGRAYLCRPADKGVVVIDQ